MLFIVAGLVVATGLFLYLNQHRDGDDIISVKNAVSRHIVLPTNEEPALLTVTDPSKLSTDFLKSTQVGDKVLVYQTNRKAIIYRPSIDRIVDVAPVVIDTPKSPTKE